MAAVRGSITPSAKIFAARGRTRLPMNSRRSFTRSSTCSGPRDESVARDTVTRAVSNPRRSASR